MLHFAQKIAHKATTPAHCVYFGLVAFESHGLYGIAAAVLLILTVPEMLERTAP